MAQEAGSEASVASTSSIPNWYDIHANSLTSWNHINSWQPPQNPNSNSSCEEDISISTTSFTNASNHSGLSVDSATDLTREAAENHLWSQVLLSVGNGGDLHTSQDVGENFLEALSSKNLSSEIFHPACDYLKKLDGGWEFTNPTSFNSLEKHMNSYNGNLVEHEKMTNLSDLVSNWSIAPPDPHMDPQMPPSTQYLEPACSQIKHELSSPSSYSSDGILSDRNPLFPPFHGHGIKGENQHHELGVSEPSFQRPLNSSSVNGYGIDINNPVIGVNSKYYNGMSDVPWSSTRNFSDFISFGNSLNRPPKDFRASKPCFKGSDSSDSKKQGHQTTSTRGSGRSMGVTSEGKKKRTEDNSETLVKKSKHEGSSTSASAKAQVPKVRLGDRITTLQQIVSPFGKTDTASVLLETIKYVNCLHEQVQLLSDPYLRSGMNKDHNSWGGLERKKEKQEAKLDLKSRGLCLVPISCTPQVYHENSGPDYWMPTYRGCFYR